MKNIFKKMFFIYIFGYFIFIIYISFNYYKEWARAAQRPRALLHYMLLVTV